ncbi:MAG TPA: hypothetical protein VE079_05380 [Ensifer sp.]|nr:hypothetical protein [Ensifer sp.]
MSNPLRLPIWQAWYAWHAVLPEDDRIFWLEVVWRRWEPTDGRWRYRSFRTRDERDAEAASQEI